jgi:hypothetical protein
MSLETIRDAILTCHKSVASIGVVHAYERALTLENQLKALYVTEIDGEQTLRGWWWRREAVEERQINNLRHLVVTQWRCRGYVAINDAMASELVFDGLIEAMRTQFRSDQGLLSTTLQSPMGDESPNGLQLLDAGPLMFCGVLCHSARLSLTTWSYV